MSLATDVFAVELQDYGVSASAPLVGPLDSLGADVQLSAEDYSARVTIEPELVSMLLRRVLREPAAIERSSPLSERLHGAFLALVAEVCRRTARAAPARATAAAREPKFTPGNVGSHPAQRWQVDFWVRLDGVTFRGRVAVQPASRGIYHEPSRDASSPVPVTLPVLLARVESTANELASLRLGDNLLFGDPERPPATLESTRTLCAPTSQRALSLERTAQGWVLRRAVLLDYEPTLEAMRDTDADDTLEGAVLDAPLDVRIEVGSVTMTAAEWLTLRQGDIVATTLPVAGPAVLRVAGREVARGELVNIEGQLGVKLTQLTPAAGS